MSAAAPAAAPASSTGEIGVKPEEFKGDRAKSSEFKTRIRLFLRANATKYNTEDKKITLFIDLCTGPIAGTWAVQRAEEIMELYLRGAICPG